MTLDEDKLKFASAFLSDGDQNQAAGKNLVGGIESDQCSCFRIRHRGTVRAMRTSMRSGRNCGSGLEQDRRCQGWRRDRRSLHVCQRKGTWRACRHRRAKERNLTVVNIVGPIDLKSLGSLAGKFGVPKDILGGPIPKPRDAPKKEMTSSQTESGLAEWEARELQSSSDPQFPLPKASASLNVLSQFVERLCPLCAPCGS